MPHHARETWRTRSSATSIPEMSAMRRPSIANKCIVPARKNGSPISPVNAVRQPSVIAQSRRSGSSSTGKPNARVFFDQFKKRSVNGGFCKMGSRNCQSLVDSVLSW